MPAWPLPQRLHSHFHLTLPSDRWPINPPANLRGWTSLGGLCSRILHCRVLWCLTHRVCVEYFKLPFQWLWGRNCPKPIITEMGWTPGVQVAISWKRSWGGCSGCCWSHLWLCVHCSMEECPSPSTAWWHFLLKVQRWKLGTELAECGHWFLNEGRKPKVHNCFLTENILWKP